jgi:hypothetical protein
VFEDDKHWEWDILFTEVTSEMLHESETKDMALPAPIAPISTDNLGVRDIEKRAIASNGSINNMYR